MKVFITGVTGFLGSELRAHFEAAGHQVTGSSTGRRDAGGAVVQHRLGEPVEPGWLAGVDVLVHAAWDLAPSAGGRNVSGAVAWREAAARNGAHALLISSYSAHPDFPSAYGRDKARAEAGFTGSGATIVRPSLVIGRGGLFADLVRRVRGSAILPLPDAGRHAVELVDVGDVCEAVQVLARERRPGSHDLSGGRLLLRALCGAIASAIGRPVPLIFPVPVAPVLVGLGVLARAGVELAARERLLGYLENARRSRRSTLPELLGRNALTPLASVQARARALAAA